jgi:hypothetical protein
MGSPVVDLKRKRSPANIRTKSLPREGLLEDSLPQVTGKENSISPPRSESRKEAKLPHTDVLRFIDHRKLKWRMSRRDKLRCQPTE